MNVLKTLLIALGDLVVFLIDALFQSAEENDRADQLTLEQVIEKDFEDYLIGLDEQENSLFGNFS